MERIFSLNDIEEMAKEIWEAMKSSRVLAFHGPMGSGKTTFIHALCDVKNVKDTVGSPLFPLSMNMNSVKREKRK